MMQLPAGSPACVQFWNCLDPCRSRSTWFRVSLAPSRDSDCRDPKVLVLKPEIRVAASPARTTSERLAATNISTSDQPLSSLRRIAGAATVEETVLRACRDAAGIRGHADIEE